MKPRIPLQLLVFLSLSAAVVHADSAPVIPTVAAVCKECPDACKECTVACKDCTVACKDCTVACKDCTVACKDCTLACKDCTVACKDCTAACKSCAEPVKPVAKVAGMPGCCPGTGAAAEVVAAGKKDCPQCAGARMTKGKRGPESVDSRIRIFHLFEAARHLQMAGLEKEAAGLQVQAERLMEEMDAAKPTRREPAQEEFLGAIEQLHLQINQLGEAVKALAQAGPDRP